MKNYWKRAIAILLCLVTAVGLCACARPNAPDTAEDGKATDTERLTDGTDGSKTEPSELEMSEAQKFISKVTYPKYAILDSSTPGFVGRWFEKDIDGIPHMVTLNDGSAFYFLTNGADSFFVNFTSLTTATTPYFSYSIDGSTPVRQLITSPEVKLPDDGMHTVCIRADGLTESVGKWKNEIGFALKSVEVNAGVLVGLMPQNKVIAFYGDSITEGINALGIEANSDVNSATAAYPYFCTQALGATEYNVGYGATGIYCVGSFNTFINAIDYLSENRRVDDGFRPDVIVVNHGTNDKTPLNAGRESAVRAELKKALDRLIEKYPDTPIFYMIPFSQRAAELIRSVCLEYGDKITVVETADWNISTTDILHPNVNGAKKAGEKLAEKIKETLGEEFFAN